MAQIMQNIPGKNPAGDSGLRAGAPQPGVTVTITRDKMSAYLTVAEPRPGVILGRDELNGALAYAGVAAGIKEDELNRFVRYPVYDAEIQIAVGVQPQNGVDGRVEYMIDYDETVAPKVMADGRVDYRDMNIVHPVAKGELLCRLHPATAGVDGKTVTGAAIPAKAGKAARMPRGRNVELGADGETLVASVDGQVRRKGATIDVVQEFEVKKDVDVSTGNILFPGDVVVRGNVLSGFVVRSGGNVTIYGLVEKASVTAAGDIVLHGGMNGQSGGALRAGGDIFAKYVENSIIVANGKVTAECIMHSTVRAGGEIELIGKKGLLVGGSAKARDNIKAVTIGSRLATLTEIDVGSDPAMTDRLKEIKAEKLSLEGELVKVRQALGMFAKLEQAGAKISPEKQLIYERTRRINDEYEAKLISLREEHDRLEQTIKNSVLGFVRVSGSMYTGVKVSIANYSMILKEDLTYCTLKSDGDEIRVSSF